MELEGVSLLDYSLDRDHNRSVVTIAGKPAAVQEAAIAGFTATRAESRERKEQFLASRHK